MSDRENTVEVEKINSEKDEDEKFSKVDKVLSMLKPGYSIQIHRIYPGWAKGYLERIEYFEDEPIDLEYIAQMWGGKVLRLRVCDQSGTYRGSVDVPMNSYPVKFRGKILRQIESDDLDLPPNTTISGVSEKTKSSNSLGDISSIFSFIKGLQSDQLRAMSAILDKQKIDPPQISNGLQNTIEVLAQLKELKGLLGEADMNLSSNNNTNDMQLFGVIADVAKTLLSNREKPVQILKNSPRPPAIQQNRRMPIQQNNQSAQTIPRISGNINQNTNDTTTNKMSVVAQLASLEPDECADAAMSALSRLSPGQRDATIAAFISRLDGFGDLEEDDYDDIDEEDLEDGENDTEYESDGISEQ